MAVISRRFGLMAALAAGLATAPVLAQTQQFETRGEMRLEQNLELVQLQRFERWLSRNPVEAIQQALEKDSSPEGMARLTKLITFKMARDVKNAAAQTGRDISWKEARRIVSRMMSANRAA